MTWWQYGLLFGIIALIWLFGFVGGKFSKAWKIAEQPEIGELVIVDNELYLHIYKQEYVDALEDGKRVTICVRSAKKTEPITD